MIAIGSKFLKDGKIYTIVEQGTWGYKLTSLKDQLILSRVELNLDVRGKVLKPIKANLQYSINDLKDIAKSHPKEANLYASINENGEDVMVIIAKNYLEIQTFQDNGWVRSDIYEYSDRQWVQSETYEGKWK